MKASMTSRERVRRTFAFQDTDRVPVDYSANAAIDRKVKAHFGLAPDDRRGLDRALGVDIAYAGAEYRGPRLHPEFKDRNVDPEWGIRTRWIAHETGGYFDYCDFPLATASDEVLRKWAMPSPADYDVAGLVRKVEKELSGYALYCGHPGTGDIINMTGMLFGMEDTLVRLMERDAATLAFIDRRHDVQLEVIRRTLEALRGKIDFVWLGEDLGTQIAPLISLDLFRDVIRPRHQRFVDLAKQYDLPVMIHTCGSSSWAYEDFIEMGIRAVDTLQPEAVNMSPRYLKDKFGGRLAFHGCISTAGPVATGTVEDTVRNCREVLDIMMPGGGYFFSPTHSLQDNSPVENVLAMYETARTHGVY